MMTINNIKNYSDKAVSNLQKAYLDFVVDKGLINGFEIVSDIENEAYIYMTNFISKNPSMTVTESLCEMHQRLNSKIYQTAKNKEEFIKSLTS